MQEPSYIIELNIQRYRALLINGNVAKELRPQVTRLLADAQARLPLAKEEEAERRERATGMSRLR